MANTNKYLSYTSRDFDSIKSDLIDTISSLTNTWTSREQSDPGMILVTLMSALGDNLSFNMDTQSLEFFGKTVSQRKNAKYIFDLLGYKMHWYEGAQLEVTISNLGTEAVTLLFNPTNRSNTQRLTSRSISSVPAYWMLNPNEDAQSWNDDVQISIPAGKSYTCNAVQGNLQSINFNGSAIDSNNRYYLPYTRLDQNHIWLQDDASTAWYLVDNIDELTDTLPRFEFDVDEYNMPYIEFVPYWKTKYGHQDGSDSSFVLYYLSTSGANGDVTPDVLDTVANLSSVSQITTSTEILVNHGTNAYYNDNVNNIPGKNPETAREAYLATRKLVGTYNTLVTVKDFEKFFLRIGIITNAFVVDGQRAKDLNESISLVANRVLSNTLSGTDYSIVETLPTTSISTSTTYLLIKEYTVSSTLYYPGAYKYVNSAWVKQEDIDENGFKSYQGQAHLVVGNFLHKDPIDSSKIYATSTPVAVDTTNNKGYFNYMPTDLIVGSASDTLVNESGLNDYKLITAKMNYAPVRRFPFYIDGQIHLKEPVSPPDANLVLQNVYNAIYLNFIAGNLEFGKKIRFSDIISVINNSDNHIDYFDAGANNSNGSLFIYPTSTDLNPYNTNSSSYPLQYGINTDITYFNPVSLQHYEDIIFPNNKLLYFAYTNSKHLTIADDSIAYKDTPNLVNAQLEPKITITTTTTTNDTYTVTFDELPNGVSINDFDFALVSDLHTIGYSLTSFTLDSQVTTPYTLVAAGWQTGSNNNVFASPTATTWSYYNTTTQQTVTVNNTVVIAYRMKETSTTNLTEIETNATMIAIEIPT